MSERTLASRPGRIAGNSHAARAGGTTRAMRTMVLGGALTALAACTRGPSPQQVATAQRERAQAVASGPCPADGLWKECNLTDRLIRAGLGVRLDSAAASDSATGMAGVLYHVGRATLAVYFYKDEASRKAAVARLDTSQFIPYEATQVYPPRTSLLQNANLLALLVSQNDAQRQRIGDAVTAGPPQPARR